MPFAYAEVLERIRAARSAGRLAHAYLFSGKDPQGLRSLALEVASEVLEGDATGHPDFFPVSPVSKTRRIRVDQIRELVRMLLLAPLRAAYKVAWIAEAERMCVGNAEAANAFLKMLEEPPANVIVLLTTTEPELLLPTILSRCIRVQCKGGQLLPEEEPEWIRQWWESPYTGALRAYHRVSLWSNQWEKVKEEAREMVGEEEAEKEEEASLVERETRRKQRALLSLLEESYWRRAYRERAWEKPQWAEVLGMLRGFEAAHRAMEQGLDPVFAVEAACLLWEEERLLFEKLRSGEKLEAR
ncbi:hypothetical protein [Candidatus Methylacidithermus pantelleriae]|uniref:DNA-directed DNA polymerase n=1 Tax=Candidatus Methylacidithermus pantelleriae TaxID=2744239 RepID=A0A8J2FN45_9BACT|nr:hypothetical protein [Candidatus Methylacidithermus pantelleriae]CAF0692960.1 conserved hypothetical protein [Candidatus Methylacidithermus pantelleriae]